MTRMCDRCEEPATRTCLSDMAYLCEEHRGTDPHCCTWCLAQLAACGCQTGCPSCALAADAPSDQPPTRPIEAVTLKSGVL